MLLFKSLRDAKIPFFFLALPFLREVLDFFSDCKAQKALKQLLSKLLFLPLPTNMKPFQQDNTLNIITGTHLNPSVLYQPAGCFYL